MPRMVQTHAEAVNEILGNIGDAVERLRGGAVVEAEAHRIGAHLLSLLEIVEHNPGIDAAADDLYAASRAFVAARQGQDSGPLRRDERVLGEALTRLCDRVAGAAPSERARELGLK
jgi:argininosuccinate lyase